MSILLLAHIFKDRNLEQTTYFFNGVPRLFLKRNLIFAINNTFLANIFCSKVKLDVECLTLFFYLFIFTFIKIITQYLTDTFFM